MLSAGIYLCGSPMASYKHFLPLERDSAPYCRTYYCIFVAAMSGDIWVDGDIFCNPCPQSSQLWGDVVTCRVRVNLLRHFLPRGWYPIWTSRLDIFSEIHLFCCARCAYTDFSKKVHTEVIPPNIYMVFLCQGKNDPAKRNSS